jgi:hypothetical protein
MAAYRWSPAKTVAYRPRRNRLPATTERTRQREQIERLHQLGEVMMTRKPDRTRIPSYVMASNPGRTDWVVKKQFAYYAGLIEERGWQVAEQEVRDQLLAIVIWADQVYGPRQSYELFSEMADAFVGLEFMRANENNGSM